MSLMRATGKDKAINKFQLQPMDSITCGYWCIAAAKAFDRGMPMADFIAKFDLQNPKKNDMTIKRMFS